MGPKRAGAESFQVLVLGIYLLIETCLNLGPSSIEQRISNLVCNSYHSRSISIIFFR